MFFIFLVISFVCVNTKYTEKANCPIDSDCTWKYPYYATQNLKCRNNRQCANGFLCCRDCHYEHRVCKSALWLPKNEFQIIDSKNQCPNTSSIYCKQKFPYLGTESYKCVSNDDCDLDFVCCADFCYQHKICKEAVELEEIKGICPKDPKICTYPLPYEKTKNYKCIKHDHCAKTHACCIDSCYTHKVCKPKQRSRKMHNPCPISIRKESCVNTNRNITKYLCENNNDCIFGYVCCEDSCYNHKVCKLPTGAFSYQSIYKSERIKTANFEQNKCPEVEEKCLKPYSLRLAKKFICLKDGDCKLGQLCCKDSCVKDFKICKNLFSIKPEFTMEVTKAVSMLTANVFHGDLATTPLATDIITIFNKTAVTIVTKSISIGTKAFNINQTKPHQEPIPDWYFDDLSLGITTSSPVTVSSVTMTDSASKKLTTTNFSNFDNLPLCTSSTLFNNRTTTNTNDVMETFFYGTKLENKSKEIIEDCSSSFGTTLRPKVTTTIAKKNYQESEKTTHTPTEFFFDESAQLYKKDEIEDGSGSGYKDDEDLI